MKEELVYKPIAHIALKLSFVEYKSFVCKKGYRNNPLTDTQKEFNIWIYDKLRAIGKQRIDSLVGLLNLTYFG